MTKQRRGTSWHWSISWLVYALMSVLMTWPLIGNLGTSLAGRDTDIYNVYWGNWWVSKALLGGQNPYFTHYLIYPIGFDLTTFGFSPFLAMLSFPLSRVTSSIAAYNLVVLLTIVLNCVAMDSLVRYLTGNAGAALVAGITLAFAPCLVAQRVTHLNLSVVAWLPWAALLLTRLMREAKIRDAVLFAVTVGLAFLTRLHIGALTLMFSGVYVGGLLLVDHKHLSRRVVSGFLLAGLLSLLVLSPLALHVQRVLSQPGGEALVRKTSSGKQIDLLAYVVPPPQHLIWGSLTRPIYERRMGRNITYWAFVGFVPLALGCYALLSHPKEALPWALACLVFFALALGPFLYVGGVAHENIRLPYSLASGWFCALGFDAPRRFSLALMPALSVLVGLACAQISTRVRLPWSSAGFASAILLEYLILPLPLMSLPPDSPFYRQMAQDGEEYAVAELPLRRSEGEIHRYYQTIHQKPIVGGWDHRVPLSVYSFIDGNPLLSAWREDVPGIVLPFQALADLAQANVRYIILHKDQLRGGLPEGARALFLTTRPVYEDASVYVLSTDAHAEQNYSIARTFSNGTDLVRPVVILDRDGATPALRIYTCWLGGAGPNDVDQYQITVTGPTGTVIDAETVEAASLKDGPVCQESSLELTLPVRAGRYQVSIEALSEGHSLGTWSTECPIQVVEGEGNGGIPLMGYRYPVAFDAPIEMLGYNLEAGDDILWIDLYWRALTDHEQAYMLFPQLLNPVTREKVSRTSDDILQGIRWVKGEIIHERRILAINEIPQGQYVLAIGLYPAGEPGERVAAFGPDGQQWPGDQAILDVPILALPRTLEGRAVSHEGRIVVYTSAGEEETTGAQQHVGAQFGDVARLQEYAVSAPSVEFGHELDVTLTWEAINSAPVDGDYTVFVHVLDESQRIIAQHDGKPVGATRPTYTWQPADIVLDAHEMVWLVEGYEGQAMIEVGLYDLLTQQRLPGYGSDGERLQDDRVLLGPIEILGTRP
jgi:hypothetical protein